MHKKEFKKKRKEKGYLRHQHVIYISFKEASTWILLRITVEGNKIAFYVLQRNN